MVCVWSGVLSTTVNFGLPEPEGVSRIAALQCCEQHLLCTENPHTKVPCYVTAGHRKMFGMRHKPQIRPSMAIVKNKIKRQVNT